MPAFVLTDAEVIINSIDLSDHVLSATLNYSGDLQEDTSMGDGSRTRLSGLKDWSLEVTFKQDYASGKVDATIFPLIGAVATAISFMPIKTGGVSATNPKFNGNAIPESYTPGGGAVGELAQTSVTFQGSGDLTRDVA